MRENPLCPPSVEPLGVALLQLPSQRHLRLARGFPASTKVQFSNYLRFLEFLGYPKYPRAFLNGPWFSYVLHRPTLVGTSRSAMTSHSIILLWKDFIRSDLRHFTGRLTQTKQQETCPRVKHPMSSYISFLRRANSGHHCGFRTLPGECINFITT